MILITKKGQRFVDVDVQALGDPNIKTADLEDARRELIALSGIPASFVGYPEPGDLRENLVNINIAFATEIIAIQNIINKALAQINDKIAKILDYEEYPSNYITPILKPPVILLLQMLEATIASVSNIQMSFASANIDFDPFYFLKKFVSHFDWKEFEEQAREYLARKKALTPPVANPNDQQSGGGF